VVVGAVSIARGDALDSQIETLLAKRHIPGLSIAIVDDGKIVSARTYGVLEAGKPERVTPDTLFQAGSVSKPVTAFGALALAEKKQISLDANVNDTLKSWHVPENTFTAKNKVTLRRILSHTAGLTVHGFPGYAIGRPSPTLVQVLDGVPPANTPAIRVDIEPGSRNRYSGGGYVVLQQWVIDVSGMTFPEYQRKTVLNPLHMDESTFEQPLPNGRTSPAATGHIDRKPIGNRWHVYPVMGPAGLWTTPSDLGRFIIGIQQAKAGRSNAVLSKAGVTEMLTVQKNSMALGLIVNGTDPNRRFQHSGRNEGFDSLIVGYVDGQQGAALMINTNDDANTLSRIEDMIAKTYHWPDYTPRQRPKAVEDKNPEVSAQLHTIFEGLRERTFDAALFSPKLAQLIQVDLASIAEQLHEFGPLTRIESLGVGGDAAYPLYHYRFIYENDSIIVECRFNDAGKIARLWFQLE
jgi:CubicO group peptidase (beta-lactamase class C family)